jgi:beta-N-acetylhexosaminidase
VGATPALRGERPGVRDGLLEPLAPRAGSPFLTCGKRGLRAFGVGITILALTGCAQGPPPEVVPPGEAWVGDPTGEVPPVLPAVEEPEPQPEAPPEPAPEPPEVHRGGSSWAEAALAEMTVREKAAQLMMPWILGDFSPEGSAGAERVRRMILDHGIGGVIVSVGSPTEVAVKLNALQELSSVPLLVGADLETGAGFRFRSPVTLPGLIELGGATDFPPLMALGATRDPRLAYDMGRVTAVEARAVGVHLPFAPVLDVNNNPDNPVINVRSFGEDPARVAELGAAFVRGIQEWGGMATGKHFPGHGDTDVDSHVDLPVVRVDRARLDSLELVPFRAAIEAGMGGIMTAHLAVPQVTGGAGVPATLSGNVLTALLRESLGFQGIIVTDALDMAAIDRRFPRGEAAVMALEAGADLLLMPPDVGVAVRAVVGAVEAGRIPEARLDASVLRILHLKEELGLHVTSKVPVEGVAARVGIPEHGDLAREIAERSMTVLRNERGLLPLRGTRTANVTVVTVRRTNDLLAGRSFNARMRQTYPRLRDEVVDRGAPRSAWDEAFGRARRSDLVVVSAHLPAAVTPPEELSRFVRRLEDARVPHVVVSFGNPYLVREFPGVQGYMLAWGSAEDSQVAAARALLGEIPVQGRTPIAIPPVAHVGDGIQLAPRR